MTQHYIPDLVSAQVRLHLAEAELRFARVREELNRTGLTTARSRSLRSQRDQLAEQIHAWGYLSALVESPGYREYRDVNG